MIETLGKMVWQFLIKLNIHLTYEPEIPLLDICPRKIKTCSHKNLDTHFIVAQTGNNLSALKLVNG